MKDNVMDAGEEAFAGNADLESHLGWETFRSLASSWKSETVVDCTSDPRSFNAGAILVLSTLLADRLGAATSRNRVGIVLPPGIGCGFLWKVAGQLEFLARQGGLGGFHRTGGNRFDFDR